MDLLPLHYSLTFPDTPLHPPTRQVELLRVADAVLEKKVFVAVFRRVFPLKPQMGFKSQCDFAFVLQMPRTGLSLLRRVGDSYTSFEDVFTLLSPALCSSCVGLGHAWRGDRQRHVLYTPSVLTI